MSTALPTSVAIAPVDQAALVASASGDLELANSFVVDSPATYALAGEELISVKAAIKKLTERREEITKPLTAVHRSVMALFKEPLDYLEKAKTTYTTRMVTYQNEQERLRREEQKRLDDLARAAREKAEAEARARLAEASKAADAEAILQAETELEIAATVVAPVVQTPVISSAGNSIRKTWKARVTDKAKLVKYVAANCDQHPELLAYLDTADTELNAAARLYKENFKVAGVESYQDSGITSRG